MPDKLHSILYYLHHLLKARHRYGHGIHSPFAFGLAQQVIFNRIVYPANDMIEKAYRELRHSGTILRIEEIGGGSKTFSGSERSVSRMARHSSVSLKYGKLLHRLADFLKPELTLELGTSIGMSGLCLALGHPEGKLITMEGNASLCDFSEKLFRRYKLLNVEVRQGLFDDLLPAFLAENTPPDLVYIDGYHQYAPTLRYFDQIVSGMKKGLIIFDDIHWSEEMHRAWQKIRSDARCVFSMDLYQMGIVCPDTSITPGHYRIRF